MRCTLKPNGGRVAETEYGDGTWQHQNRVPLRILKPFGS